MLDVALAAEPALSVDPFASRLLALLAGSTAPAVRATHGDEGQPSASAPTLAVRLAPQELGNYVIPDDLTLGAGSPKAKAIGNLAAIRLLKQLSDAGTPASEAAKRILAGYVGWGGLPQAFRRPDGSVTEGWESIVADMEQLLSTDELDAARHSTTDAHYTPRFVIEAIYAGLRRLGWKGGKVLEPAVGVGHFIGLAPAELREATRWTTVELDTLSASICSALYPAATVLRAGFQDVELPHDHFDAAIGNPPFGSNTLYDRHNKDLNHFTLHNFFFAKSLRAVVPGGLVAMVVSRTLMDKASGRERAWLAEHAHLLGAIRLPNNTFKANAGTEVTTDILFLQKVREGEIPDTSWAHTVSLSDPDGGDAFTVNRYFGEHPDQMLGRLAWVSGPYGLDMALLADPSADLPASLAAAIQRLPENINLPAPGSLAHVLADAGLPPPAGTPVFGHFVAPDGTVWQRRPNVLDAVRSAPVDVPARDLERLRALIDLRLDLRALLDAEQDRSSTDATLVQRRQRLNATYDAFVKRFGYLNSTFNVRVFRDDADAFLVRALETDYQRLDADEAARAGLTLPKGRSTMERASKASIFGRRVLHPITQSRPETPQDALAASLNLRGRLDPELMGSLLGRHPDDVMASLGDLVYRDPSGAWETADAYLSGNVKTKLAAATEAASRDPAFTRNVLALEAVQPADLSPSEIHVALGSPWVPTSVYEAFAREVVGLSACDITFVPGAQRFIVSGTGDGHSRFGTADINARGVFSKSLSRHAITIYRPTSDGGSVVDREASEAARQQGELLQQEFAEWVWKDLSRREQLARIYNDRFNTDVARRFDGSHLTFPGKVADEVVTLRKHQVDVAWRMICTGRVLVDHEVGAGKSYATVAALMEMRRIGLIQKPLVTVPNGLVDQWAQEVLRLYPAANILAVSEADFTAERRKLMFARIATGDWDMVIVPHSQFTRIRVPDDFKAEYLQARISDMASTIGALNTAQCDGRVIKQIEKARDKLEARLTETLDGARHDDRTASIDEMGIDAIVCDESHLYKNLFFSTCKRNVSGLGNPAGSQRAEDLYLKTRYLQSRKSHAAVYFLTGTPVANSLVEIYTLMRYLATDELDALGLTGFDLWANTFAEEAVNFEIDSSGQGLKAKSVLKRFLNLPELMSIYHRFADTVTDADLKRIHLEETGKPWPVPAVAGGKPESLVVAPSAELLDYIENNIIPRMAAVSGEGGVRPDPRVDNPLKITNDARLAALDLRLRVPGAPDDPDGKVSSAVRQIAAIYHQWTDRRGTQLVFCDLSTPSSALRRERAEYAALLALADSGDETAQRKLAAMSPDELLALEGGFSVYDDVRAKLIAAGVAPHEIAFIHDAHTPLQRRALFAKMNRGDVRILMGSTNKMGAGMNVQKRLVALTHLDAPWRPSDLTQREGRLLRQGNLFYEQDPTGFVVRIIRCGTQRTYDSRMWQLIERKAAIIEQLRRAEPGMRDIDDIASQAASASELKAACTGNPLIIEQVELQATVKRLSILERSHREHRWAAESRVNWITRDGGPDARRAAALATIDAAEAHVAANPRDPFRLSVNGAVYDDSRRGARALADEVAYALNRNGLSTGRRVVVGEFRGVELSVRRGESAPDMRLHFNGTPLGSFAIPINEDGQLGPIALLNRLDKAFAAVGTWRAETEARYRRDLAQLADHQNLLAQPFRFAQELRDATERLQAVTAELIKDSRKRMAAVAAAALPAEPVVAVMDDDLDSDLPGPALAAAA